MRGAEGTSPLSLRRRVRNLAVAWRRTGTRRGCAPIFALPSRTGKGCERRTRIDEVADDEMTRDSELLPGPLRQVHQPPADHAVQIRLVKAEQNLPKGAEVTFPSWRCPVISRVGDLRLRSSEAVRAVSAVAAA